MNKEQWLKERRNYIGGSDVAAILGLSKWKSPLAVYMEKIGELENKESTRRMEMGNRLEHMVAEDFVEEYKKDTGKEIKVRNVNKVLIHPQYDFIRANIDRKIEGKDEGLECKTTEVYNIKEWDDNAPMNYIVQCMHYMAVTGFKKWWLACWVGFGKFVYYELNFDAELIDKIMKAEIKFWNNHVLKKIPPDVNCNDGELLNELYPGGQQSIILTGKENEIVKYLEIDKEIKRLKKEKDLYANQIKQELGDHETATCGNYSINWKSQNRISLDSKQLKEEHPEIYNNYSKESKLRMFKIKEIKNG